MHCWSGLLSRPVGGTKNGLSPPINSKKSCLIFAFCAVSAIALLYGIDPLGFARRFLGIAASLRDAPHILRVMTGLYLALGCFWLYAASRPAHRDPAIVTTAVFSGGLVPGRLLSFALNGWPSALLVFYTALELGLLPIALWVLRRPD